MEATHRPPTYLGICLHTYEPGLPRTQQPGDAHLRFVEHGMWEAASGVGEALPFA